MFRVSKKLLLVLVVISLVLGGERRFAEGLMKCFRCYGDKVSTFDPICGPDHDGLDEDCFSPPHACAMVMEGDKIEKRCEFNATKWKGADGNPKCIKNKECYCNDVDFCNKDKNFGMDSGTEKTGSVGTQDMFRGMSILFGIMVVVPSVFTS